METSDLDKINMSKFELVLRLSEKNNINNITIESVKDSIAKEFTDTEFPNIYKIENNRDKNFIILKLEDIKKFVINIASNGITITSITEVVHFKDYKNFCLIVINILNQYFSHIFNTVRGYVFCWSLKKLDFENLDYISKKLDLEIRYAKRSVELKQKEFRSYNEESKEISFEFEILNINELNFEDIIENIELDYNVCNKMYNTKKSEDITLLLTKNCRY